MPPREHSVRSFSRAPAARSEVVGRFAPRQAREPNQNGFRIRSLNAPAVEAKFQTFLIGKFNFYNIFAAAAAVKNYDVDLETIQRALDKIKNIPGRLEFIDGGQNFKVVVDYAHTPGSLKAVYETLRDLIKDKNSKLFCVLGAAGGGRDKWKRPVLGKVASRYCDKVIITDEDPYDEPPEKIIDEVAAGIEIKKEVRKILDRRAAIKEAMTKAAPDDIVVITGKGSENSIAVAGGRKIDWSDKKVVLELLREISKDQ